MARVQIGVHRAGSAVDAEATSAAYVYVRGVWFDEDTDTADDSNTWKIEPYLIPIVARQEVLGGSSHARFRWNVGERVRRRDKAAFEVSEPVLTADRDWFVKIVVTPNAAGTPENEPNPDVESFVAFFGVIPRQSFNVMGEAESGGVKYQRTEQYLNAYGMDWILRKTQMPYAYVDDGDGGVAYIDHEVLFGTGEDRGLEFTGNRSASRATFTPVTPARVSDYKETQAYYFKNDGYDWSLYDVAEYLLNTRAERPKFLLAPSILAFMSNFEQVFKIQGRNLLECLVDIIDRRRGLMADIVSDADGMPVVRVWQIFDEPIALDDVVIPANQNQVVVDISATPNDPDTTVIEIDRQESRSYLLVRGARTRSMFTVSYGDGNIEAGWTSANEIAYKAASGADDADLNDQVRARFDDVYRRFVIPDSWNGLATGGHACIPVFDTNARLSNLHGNTDIVYPPEIRVQRELFLKNQGADTEGDYDPIFVLAKNDDDKWYYIERGGEATAHVQPLDKTLGVKVLANPAHLLAKNHFEIDGSTTFASKTGSPVIDWQSMLFTISIQTNVRPTVIEVVSTEGNGTCQVIDVESVQTWWLVRNTVIGLDGSGDKFVANPGTVIADWRSDGVFIRNDTERLRKIATLAKAWYARSRAKVQLQLPGIQDVYPLGTIIQRVIQSWRSSEIGTPVTARTFDFERQTTTIETQIVEPDFSRFV